MHWNITHSDMKEALYRIKKEKLLQEFKRKHLYSFILFGVLLVILLTVKGFTVVHALLCVFSVVAVSTISIVRSLNDIKADLPDLHYQYGIIEDYCVVGNVGIARVNTKDGIYTVSVLCDITESDRGSLVILLSIPNKNKVAVLVDIFENYEFNY